MESPVVLDKPPEYHANNNERGFPFEEEEGSGAWSELAARHPDIAARLRPRAPAPAPHTWARKRRPDAHTSTDGVVTKKPLAIPDFDDDDFAGLNRFHFDDIPPEFREHFPTHWNRRFSSRDEPPPQPASTAAQQPTQQQQPPPPQQQQTAATQTEFIPEPEATQIPQYGLRNTVDLGQKSPADPSLVNAEERGQRSVSAPPEASQQPAMSHNKPGESEPPGTVRHIPIFVEGRDEPVINKTEFAPPPPPHADRNQYYDDGPSFHPPPNFSRSFGTPFNKGYRQGPQPFVQQKVYPQAAYGRAGSPQRPHSPHEEFVKVPVHHEHAARPDTPTRHQPPQQHQHHPQQHQQQHHPQQQHQQQHHPQQHQPPQQPQHQQPPQHQQQPQPAPQQQRAASPPQPKPQPSANDPITLILSIQTDVLNLMTDVENFTGTKKDKRYLYLDEMLTRNLIKLDNIETDGKENIRLARKEAIRCIQKCIAVLEAKAEKGSAEARAQEANMQDNEAKENEQNAPSDEHTENAKEAEPEQQPAAAEQTVAEPPPPADATTTPQPPDTRPEEPHTETIISQQPDTDNNTENTEKPAEQPTPNAADTKSTPKKVAKTTKKKVKDKVKNSNVGDSEEKSETMQVDNKGDCKPDSQAMDIDGAASQ